MLRVVLAVLLAVALVGASLPAVERARVASSDAAVEREATALATAVERACADSDPVTPGGPGARRVVTLALPARSWGHAGVERVRVTPRGVRWRVRGGARHRLRFDGPAALDRPIELRGAGRHRLRVACERRAGRAVAVVRRGTGL
ncbi:DUF7311 family protein [Halomarina pelagica]|uniref:DUF7311 family protein n=1 Tax=Halomarina pelagica TaxID=2961599 RepID=UPI0020C47E98|nr:hypothetical protein [Halomarina sp. BND7]